MTVLANLSIGTPKAITVVFDAFSIFASFTGGTGHAQTSVNTDPFLTFFVRGAGHVVATVAESVATLLTTGTLTITAGSTTCALDTGFACGASCVVVGLSVTVIVETVADLGLWQGSITSRPLTIAADLFAFSTSGFTGADQLVVDLAVTVVVFAITDFWLGLGSRTPAELSIDA